MRSRNRLLRFGFGAAALSTWLLFPLPRHAQAWQGDLQTEPLHEVRERELAAAQARKRTMSAVENPKVCGKCHSSCEPGRTHGGRAASVRQGNVELPLTADGRVTCLTCHLSHVGSATAAEHGLRVPNLKRELCLACHPSTAADALTLEILSPPERALVREGRLALIGRTSRPTEGHFTVRLNDTTFHVQAAGQNFATWLTLREGVNRYEVSLGGSVLWQGEVFHGDGDGKGYARSAVSHRTGSQQECRGCHDDAGEYVAVTANRSSALCYGCHERLDEKRYLHGPLGVGACLACHDPHSGYGAAHLREEQALLCGSCHAARETVAASACMPLGRACSDCHDPHQSDMRYLLKGSKYTLLHEADGGR